MYTYRILYSDQTKKFLVQRRDWFILGWADCTQVCWDLSKKVGSQLSFPTASFDALSDAEKHVKDEKRRDAERMKKSEEYKKIRYREIQRY